VEIIPLQAIPNQSIQQFLDGQTTQINVYQKSTGLYCDVLVSGVAIISGVICRNLNRIVRDLYLGFLGDLMFLDQQGDIDPYYTGLGTRWVLVYLAPSDLPTGAG
jgi:hypothetical protein